MADECAEEITDAPEMILPSHAGQAAHEQPGLWRPLQDLGREASRAAPLDARTRTRRAMTERFSAEEVEHAAWLAVTTLGWPQAIRSRTWSRDITQPDGGGRQERC